MKALTSFVVESSLSKALAEFAAALRREARRALTLHLETCAIVAEAHERRVRVESRRQW
ncbi:hypothetical protein [Trinickia violacea]|uniref:hypothetical protein n=1 Tax=Trinickia violacea TaxID=2571746 RepID=UPI001585E0A9|nr:hypothetical protein [Trinickia violacea]